MSTHTVDRTPAAPGGKPSRMTPKSMAIWGAVALVGAVCWSVLALSRGEDVSALWVLFAALSSYAIAYRFYARFIAYKVLQVDDRRATPAERLENGQDFDVTDRRVLFGHHFAAIAGAGPLVGPVLAAQMGYLPGTIWIIVGVIFAGAVQDMVVLFFSMRRDGKSLGQMVREEIGVVGGIAALIAVFAIMIIILAVLALVVVNALAESPWGVFSIGLTIPIALFMGFYLRILRPGRVAEVTVIGVGLLLLALIGGGYVERAGHRERAHPLQGAADPGHGRLRLRGLDPAGVDAAHPARLPVDVHEGRRDRAARRRHGDRRAGPPGRRRSPTSRGRAPARSSPASSSRSSSSPSPAVRSPASTP